MTSMKSEIKICLPLYKIIYAICFVVLLSIVRGISFVDEIGITLDANMAILAIVFCADTLQMEYAGKRWEVFRLYSLRSRQNVILKRIAVQYFFLLLLSVFGYACFFWQRPRDIWEVSDGMLFLSFLAAVAVTVFFWAMVTVTFANLCRNSLAGIAITMVIWILANSTLGERVLGNFNIFAFVFRDTRNVTDMGWLWGKGIALLIAALFVAAQPIIMKKRG